MNWRCLFGDDKFWAWMAKQMKPGTGLPQFPVRLHTFRTYSLVMGALRPRNTSIGKPAKGCVIVIMCTLFFPSLFITGGGGVFYLPFNYTGQLAAM